MKNQSRRMKVGKWRRVCNIDMDKWSWLPSKMTHKWWNLMMRTWLYLNIKFNESNETISRKNISWFCCCCIFDYVTGYNSFQQILIQFQLLLYPDDCVQFLKKQALGLALPVRVFTIVPGKPIVVITWEGKEPALSSVLLNSHMDVVPVFPVSFCVKFEKNKAITLCLAFS